MLVLIGATPEGKKELVGFQTGVRESAQSWRELLIDIKQRGLEIADLANTVSISRWASSAYMRQSRVSLASVGRPRSLISGRLSRAGARTRRGRGSVGASWAKAMAR
jgi:hypothetical protein